MRYIISLLWLLCAFGAGVYCWHHMTPVYVYLSGLALVYAVGVMLLHNSTFARMFGMGLVSLSLLFGIMELYFYISSLNAPQYTFEEGHKTHTVPDAVLGYTHNPEQHSARCTLHLGDTLAYDVTYTRGKYGNRITPDAPEATQGVFFFGCSFTYGEGVEDTQTYPYLVGLGLGKDYQAYNLGVIGYGPHQFLAALESGRYKHLFDKYKKIHIIFLLIEGHVFRAAGLAVWDTHGPRYELENNTLIRRGTFADKMPNELILQKITDPSFLIKHFKRHGEYPFESRILKLQNAILLEARQYVLTQYPQATFTILTYPDAHKAAALLKAYNVHPLELGQFLPGFMENKAPYRLPDKHPNAMAYKRIADGLLLHITVQ